MVQLLTWEWLARDIMFQLANGRFTGPPWRRSGRVMVCWMPGNHRDIQKDQDSGRNRARTRWLCIREKEPWKICEGLKGFEDD